MLLAETHFPNKRHLKFPSYIGYYMSHPDGTAHRGTAILIKNKIKHIRLSPLRPIRFKQPV